MARKPLIQRIALEGAPEIRKQLAEMGAAGGSAFRTLDRHIKSTERASIGFSGRLNELRARFDAVGVASQRLGQRFRFLRSEAAGVAASIGAVFSLRGLAQVSDVYTGITNQLRVVAGEQANVNALLGRVAQIAKDTRTPLADIASLYQRTSLTARELGANQNQVLRVTRNVGLALAQTGTSTSAARGALQQLSQAFGSTVIRMEEFNSLQEGGLPILQAVANGIDRAGGSIARLRQLVLAEEVSNRDFFEALLSQSEDLEAAFAKTVPTIGQAFEVLNTNFILWVGTANESRGVAAGVAQALLWVADNLNLVIAAGIGLVTVFAAVKGIGLAVELFAIAKALVAMLPALAAVGTALLANPMTLWALSIVAATTAILYLTGNLGKFVKAVQGVFQPIAETVGGLLGLNSSSEEADKSLNNLGSALLGLGSTGAESIGGVSSETKALTANFDQMGESGSSAALEIGRGVQTLVNTFQNLQYELSGAAEAAQRLYNDLRAVGGSSGSFTTTTDTSGGSIVQLAGGGGVSGPGTGTSDSILARLSNGEFVVRAAAVRKYGASFMHALNGMRLPKFAGGGFVDSLTAGMQVPAFAPAGFGDFTPAAAPGVSGRPLTLQIGDEVFEGLLAPELVADRLGIWAQKHNVRRAGRKPAWLK